MRTTRRWLNAPYLEFDPAATLEHVDAPVEREQEFEGMFSMSFHTLS